MVYRLIRIQEREQKLHLYFDCRYNNLEIDHPLAATFLLLLSRTACLCFRVKVELRLPMTCLSSIFWIRGKSNEKILQKTDSSKLQGYTDRMTYFKFYQICFNMTQGRIQDFNRRGCTRLLLYFNTNKPHNFFLQNTSCIRKPQVISGGGGAHPLHPPPRSAPVTGDETGNFGYFSRYFAS